jgi:DNA-binding CsgD family transcriptional regulator
MTKNEPRWPPPEDDVEQWRWLEQVIEHMELRAQQTPGWFAQTMLRQLHDGIEQLRQEFLRFFGSREPQTRKEKQLHDLMLWEYGLEELWLDHMVEEGKAAMQRGEHPAASVCEAFLDIFRELPRWYSGMAFQAEEQLTKEVAAGRLANWTRVYVSKSHGHIQQGLAAEGISLEDALSAEVLCTISELSPNVPLRPPGGGKESFISLVERKIASPGDEVATRQATRQAKSELFARDINLPEVHTESLFETQEAVREELSRLAVELGLTRREEEIVELAGCEEKSTAEIARILNISESTVRVHRKNTQDKAKRAQTG